MKNKFAERFKELRMELGLSQNQLAKNLNVSRSCVSGWEIGTREPDINTLIILAKYFNVSLDFLLGLED